jgi:hypothetical protein
MSIPLVFVLAAAMGAIALLQPAQASAQAIRVGVHRPKPQLFAFTYLAVTASPSNVNFTLVKGGAATGSSSVAITTTYVGLSLNGLLTLYAYFASAPNALTGGTPSSSIPSSDVFGLCPTGTPTSYTAFTQTTPYSGASGLQIYQVTSLLAINLPGSRTDNLTLKIDLTSTPQLPAATYTGTITLEAQSF